MNQPPRYQPQNGRDAMDTGGFVGDYWGSATVAPIGTNQIFEPSPIAGGSNKGNCSSGFVWTVFNVVAHIITLILTMVAAAANYKHDKHLTLPHNDDDFVSSWCLIMLICSPLAVIIWVGWFGFVRRSFQTPIIATLGGTLFFAVFICTVKLSYYLEISEGIAKNAGHPPDNPSNGGNSLDGDSHEMVTTAALYFQCLILVTSFYTPLSGTYYKVLQMEKAQGYVMDDTKSAWSAKTKMLTEADRQARYQVEFDRRLDDKLAGYVRRPE